MKLIFDRRKLTGYCVVGMLPLLLFISVFQSSLLTYVNAKIAKNIYLLGIIIRIILMLVGLITIRFRRKELLQVIIVSILSLGGYFLNGGFMIFDLFFLSIVFGKYLQYKTIVNIYFYPIFVGVIGVIVFYLMGYLPEYNVTRFETTIVRFSCGFSHPNVCGRLIFCLCLLYILKKGRRLNFVDMGIIAISAYLVYAIPNSVTSSLMIVFLDIGIIITKVYSFLFKREITSNIFLRIISLIMIPLIITWVFYVVLNSGTHSVLEDISETFYSRFWGGLAAIKRYPIKLFGNDISFITSAQIYFGVTNGRYFVIDCLYVLLLVKYGIIITIYFMYQMYNALFTSVKRRDNFLFIAIVLLLIYSIAENGLTIIYFSFVFMLGHSQVTENV